MSQQNPVQYGEHEPPNRDGQKPTVYRPPTVMPKAESLPKEALSGAAKGTMLGLGTKFGKWIWEKGAELKSHLLDD
jgi:hypothetical protein